MSAPTRVRPTLVRPTALDFDAAVRAHLAGRFTEALAGYDALIAAVPTHAEAHNNAGALRVQLGDRPRAIAHLRAAVAARADYAEAVHNLGLALAQQAPGPEAIAHLARAVQLEPTRGDWWTDLGNASLEDQRCDDALRAYETAITLLPRNVTALSNRAIALRGLRRHADAVAASDAALAVDPAHVDTLNNLGVILKELRDFDGARAAFERALAAAPGHSSVRVNLAVLMMEMNRHDEAHAIAAALVEERPDDVEALNVLGNCAFERGAYADARRYHERAVARIPDDRNANWNLAVLTLLEGDFALGFPRFESRKRLVSVLFTRRHYDAPEWDGTPLAGRTIFVHAEQGLGDVLQFVRYAAVLKAQGAGRVIVECPPSAMELVRGVDGVDVVIAPDAAPPAFDVHAYLMSLPLLCGTTSEAEIPSVVPYLTVPARVVGARVGAAEGRRRVGIVWAGNPMHQRDKIRSLPLGALAPILMRDDVQWFSLQKGAPVAELASPIADGIIDLDAELADFSDTASAIAALDLVITVDTSVAHLAGGLGVPTWVLLPSVPDWRWMLERTDSPWYPTMRLFRQTERGDWAGVVGRVSAALDAFVAATPSPAMPVAPRSAVPPAPATAAAPPIEIGWPVGLTSGWGTYGLQLALSLADSGRATPVLGEAPLVEGLGPVVEHRLRRIARATPSTAAPRAVRLNGLGNGAHGAPRIGARPVARDVGVIFFEDTAFGPDAVARANAYERIIAGSTWNAELLKAFGVERVRMVLQGVDPTLFHPWPKRGLLGDRFCIFSGGKLEFRKGQDIVVAAFRRFHATHPDALLVTAWHNHWPQTMAGIDAAGHVRGMPDVRDGRCDVTAWLVANGLPRDAVLDLGVQPQATIAPILREMDAAVFPNRAEGGTNLVAMEAMASGVPTILSANTGHLNLIGRDTCFALEHQAPVTARCALYNGTFSWGESDPDEIVAQLERIHADRAEAQRRGAAGARLLAELPWTRQAHALLDALDD